MSQPLQIVEMVVTNEILATFFVDPINAELSEEDERKHQHQLASIDDIRRLIVYHFIKELPAAKSTNQETEKELDRFHFRNPWCPSCCASQRA
jgi:hypothetical protein